MVEYLRRKTTYQGVLLQSVYGQLSPRSWSTIKIWCHYSPQSLSTAAIRIHHQLPPRLWSTTIIRCQHDKGSANIIAISQHDTESAILDPPLRSLISHEIMYVVIWCCTNIIEFNCLFLKISSQTCGSIAVYKILSIQVRSFSSYQTSE